MKHIKQMLAGTFSVLVAFIVGLPPACASTDATIASATSAVPSFETNTDYVIRNMETGLFLRCSSDKLHAAYFGSIGETDFTYYLWQFKPSVGGAGYALYNEGRKACLNDNATTSTYRGKTDDTGVTWYITPNPYNGNGYFISSNQEVATTPTKCLYAYYKTDAYYLSSSEGETADLSQHTYSGVKYYQLPTFQFYTYDQLFTLAQKCGYTGTKATGAPTQSDWNALVSCINQARPLNDVSNISSTVSPVHNFVIASRRYHKFLNIDNKGNLHAADKITTSSIFQVEATYASERTFYSAYHGDGATFTLSYANNGHDNDFLLKSGDNYLCMDSKGAVSQTKYTSSYELSNLDKEWVVVESPYDDNLQYLNVSKTDIRDVENWNFRIENNAKRIKLISGTANGSNQGGFLTDVDKTALEPFDAEKKTNIAKADVFSNSVNLRDAANIWHLTLAVPGKDDANNQPIGIVSDFTHSLYYIQNVNSKKFIGNPADGSQLMPLISETSAKSNRALFYLVPKDESNDNGVYAMMLLDRNNSKTTEVPLGYLDIADTDDNGLPDKSVSSDYNQAALVYQKATSTDGLPADAYNWSFHRARFIQARAVDSQNASAFKGYRYVSLWFPFDIVNTDPDVTLYIAKWLPDYSGIRFYPTASLPAGYGAVALAKDDDAHQLLKFYIDKATGYRSDINDDVLKGVSESEDFVLSDDASSAYYRKGIYVFSETLADKDYTDVDLSLGYPADPFLMANRCYVQATSESEKTVAKGKAFTFIFDDDNTTGIHNIQNHQEGPMIYYDLQGRRVSHPSKGIYITNGKKIIFK